MPAVAGIIGVIGVAAPAMPVVASAGIPAALATPAPAGASAPIPAVAAPPPYPASFASGFEAEEQPCSHAHSTASAQVSVFDIVVAPCILIASGHWVTRRRQRGQKIVGRHRPLLAAKACMRSRAWTKPVTKWAKALVSSAAMLIAACAGAPPAHGTITSLSLAKAHDWKACEHRVPEEVCTRCHPERLQAYKDRGDYCKEHGVPESQCLECHPDLDFSPPKPAPANADVKEIAKSGEDIPALEPFVVAGQVTVFDFWAGWCPPCRKVDEHLHQKLGERAFAIRKIDVSSWDSPVAKRWLARVPSLPYLVVYARDGRRVAAISGPDFAAIDSALEEAAR
jgi:thiol-disulfide isomerase/thioredoxin